MTFKEFLAQRRRSHDILGDFVRLANADPHFPDSESLEEIRTYFEMKHGSLFMADAGRDLWKEYKKACAKALRAQSA